MFSAAIYSPLSDTETYGKERISGKRSEIPLLDEGDPFSSKKSGRKARRYVTWIIYFGSILATSGLLVTIQQNLRDTRRECWDMFNYYCQ